MGIEDLHRRVQLRQGSYVITIPSEIIHVLRIKKNQYVRFAVINSKIVIKTIDSKITKKDLIEAERCATCSYDEETFQYETDCILP